MVTGEVSSNPPHGLELNIKGLTLSIDQIRFLNETITGTQRITNGGLVSLILFGSVVKGGAVIGVSDFDMILVVGDGVSAAKITELKSHLASVCSARDIADSASLIFEGIPKFVMRETGMFVSHIVCRERDFLSMSFSKVFDTNPIISRLIVPSSIVMGSVLGESRIVFGKDIVPSMKLPRSNRLDILRSLLMNELLVVLSIFYSFTYNSTKLAMEATKWSVYNAMYLLTGESKSLADSIRLLTDLGHSPSHLERLLSLRREYRRDTRFNLSSFGSVARVHLFIMNRWKRPTIVR